MLTLKRATFGLAVLTMAGVPCFAGSGQANQAFAAPAGNRLAITEEGDAANVPRVRHGADATSAGSQAPGPGTGTTPVSAGATDPTTANDKPGVASGSSGPSNQSPPPSAPEGGGGFPESHGQPDAGPPSGDNAAGPDPPATGTGHPALPGNADPGATVSADPGTPADPRARGPGDPTSAGGAAPGAPGDSAPRGTPEASIDPRGAGGTPRDGHGASSQTDVAQSNGPSAREQGTGATESNATTEAIWQGQISGCIAYCHGTSQVQIAAQENATVQVLVGAPEAASGPQAQDWGAGTQSTTSITQIQVGCVAHCYGTTTVSTASMLAYYQQMLEEVLSAVAPGVEQMLVEVLSSIATMLPALPTVVGTEQSTATLTSYQWQDGQGLTLVQMQSASQSQSTIQIYYVATSATDTAQAAVDASAATAALVNQTEQAIWQVQIGCLFMCVQTEQYQQADQSNTTVEVILLPQGASPDTATDPVDVATQIVWQLQIGCLFWCFDATEQQVVASENAVMLIESNGAAAAPTLSTLSSPHDTGMPQVAALPAVSGPISDGAGAKPIPANSASAPVRGPARPVHPASMNRVSFATTISVRRGGESNGRSTGARSGAQPTVPRQPGVPARHRQRSGHGCDFVLCRFAAAARAASKASEQARARRRAPKPVLGILSPFSRSLLERGAGGPTGAGVSSSALIAIALLSASALGMAGARRGRATRRARGQSLDSNDREPERN